MSNEVNERSALTSAAPEPTERGREVDRDRNESVLEKRESRVIGEDPQLMSLFAPDVAKDFRSRWIAVQSSFVDDPRAAVKQGDDLPQQFQLFPADFRRKRAEPGDISAWAREACYESGAGRI